MCAVLISLLAANHLGGQTPILPVMFADAHEEDIVVDPCDLLFRPAPSIDASRASIYRPSVDWGGPLQPSAAGARLGKNHLQNGTEARKSSGRDPTGTYRCSPPRGVRAGFLSCATTVPSRPTAVGDQFTRACLADCSSGSQQLEEQSSPQCRRKADISFSPRGVGDVVCTAVGILANDRVNGRRVATTGPQP